MADIGDRCPSQNDLNYSRYRAFCERLGYRAASYDFWLRLENPGNKRMGHIYRTRAEHEAAKASYRAKLASEAASALAPYAE